MVKPNSSGSPSDLAELVDPSVLRAHITEMPDDIGERLHAYVTNGPKHRRRPSTVHERVSELIGDLVVAVAGPRQLLGLVAVVETAAGVAVLSSVAVGVLAAATGVGGFAVWQASA
jgi:hypothetical protein